MVTQGIGQPGILERRRGWPGSVASAAWIAWTLACFGCTGEKSPEKDNLGHSDVANPEVDSASGEDLLHRDAPLGDAASEALQQPDETISYPWDDHQLTVMSFNVMCSFCSNDPAGNEKWAERVPHMGDILKRHAPDLVGLQELTFATEVEEIQAVAPGYLAVYPKDLPKNLVGWTDYPDASILYRKERFSLVEQGTYWLSETPDTPWTTGWASTNIWRVVVWARLKQVSDGREIYFASTHFDNNVPNQQNSAPLALTRAEAWANEAPVVFVGDFNSKPDSIAYGILNTGVDGSGFHLTNAFDLAGSFDIVTNVSPEPAYNPAYRIDHIWVAGTTWTASNWAADLTVYGPDNLYPSDHFPISCNLIW